MKRKPDNGTLLRQLMDNMSDHIFFKDRDHKFIMINKSNAEFFGFHDPQEAVGKDDFDLFEPEFARKALEDEEHIMETGQPLLGDEETTIHEGYVGWGSVTKLPLRDKDGNIFGIMGIGRDITELKLKELELKEANDQIAEDLRMAAQLQHTFLPHIYPVFSDANGRSRIGFYHHYEADTQIGGDFCSIYPLDSTKAGLLICDVMGHGVRAALVTALIKAIADEVSKSQETAGQFLTEMNRRLYSLLRSGDVVIFATACYAIIDTATGNLEVAVAGHPPPILMRSGEQTAAQLTITPESRGPALAIESDFKYHTFSTDLAAGDSLLMYTDGIIEATNSDNEEFGKKNLLETMDSNSTSPLHELVPKIVEQSRAFSATGKFGDDICLVGFTLARHTKAV